MTQTTAFKNKKTQLNKFTDVIEEYGITGDVAGVLVNKLNRETFEEVSGQTKSSLKNILSIDEYTYAEKLELEQAYTNIIERVGDDYFIHGNYTNETDKSLIQSNLNTKLLILYIHKGLKKFFDNIISRNYDRDVLLRLVNDKMIDVTNSVKNYLTDFTYSIDYDDNSKELYINLYEQYNKQIDRFYINITELI